MIIDRLLFHKTNSMRPAERESRAEVSLAIGGNRTFEILARMRCQCFRRARI